MLYQWAPWSLEILKLQRTNVDRTDKSSVKF